MLRSDVIDVINSGDAWAFVGSGASVDAGLPTWRDLLEGTLRVLDEATRDAVSTDGVFRRAFDEGDFPRCFKVIETRAGRDALEAGVAAQIEIATRPGRLLRQIADWPFRGYITTNYDSLLEAAMADAGQLGWVEVGNTDDETRKVSANAERVVSHLHGAVGLPEGRSHLVLTERDYDDLYLTETTISRQLTGLLAQHRVVFLGFGFHDAELIRVLKKVGLLTSPARPLFAFLPDLVGGRYQSEIAEFLDRFNVDVLPYSTADGSHDALKELLEVYRSFTIRRSLNFGGERLQAPSFDPQTTGLLIYNELCLRQQRGIAENVLETLMRARLLSVLHTETSVARSGLLADLDARTRPLRKVGVPSSLESDFNKIIGELERDGLVDSLMTGEDPTYFLTDNGRSLVSDKASTSERLRDQFMSSLKGRSSQFVSHPSAADRIADAADAFFKEALDQRALGIAGAIAAPLDRSKSYHMVGLLQDLPRFMEQLKSEEEAIALSKLIQDVLARPNAAERQYLGLALQAQFGVHLLGASPEALVARTQELTDTAFLLDSSTAIPFLARSSVGHDGARLLVHALQRAGSVVFTTYLLAIEVAEHARWAIQNVGSALVAVEGLRATTGRSGGRSNVFLDGLIEEVSQGRSQPDLLAYLGSTVGCSPASGTCRNDDVKDRLSENRIGCFGFEEFPGYETEFLVDRDEVADRIAELRKERGSYRHERQVRAEAEALLLITGLRKGTVELPDRKISNAFFISHTRVVDNAAGPGIAVTMRPEGVLQWVNTLMPCPLEELGALVGLLVYELMERGLEVVDRQRLQVTFAPLINASREKLTAEIEQHRVLLAARYGEDGARAFRDTGDLDVPVVLEGFYAQRAQEMGQRISTLEKRVEVAESKGKLSDREKQELDRLRLEKSEKRRRELKRRRAAASNPKRRKRRKG